MRPVRKIDIHKIDFEYGMRRLYEQCVTLKTGENARTKFFGHKSVDVFISNDERILGQTKQLAMQDLTGKDFIWAFHLWTGPWPTIGFEECNEFLDFVSFYFEEINPLRFAVYDLLSHYVYRPMTKTSLLDAALSI